MEHFIRAITNFDGENLYLDLLETGKHTLNIKDIIGIKIITTDQGPFMNDLFLYITDNKGNVFEIESEMPTFERIHKVFEKIPGFDYNAFIASMSSVENNEFICYKKE